MDACDVLIVGGGPAGSSCAWALRDSGLDVRVIDRRAFPRDKVCAGWVTPQVISALQLDLEDFSRRNVCQPITGFRTGILGQHEVENHYDHPVSYGIRRCEFDDYLLRRCGARCETRPVDKFEKTSTGWLVDGQLSARMLVGAGGHFCPVAKLLGARSASQASVVAAQEIEFLATPQQLAQGSIEATVPELFFCDDLQGYGWCFRKGNFLNIGLGRTDRHQLGTHVQRFVEFLEARGKIAGELPARFHGHAYQLYERHVPMLAGDGVILVGDSAGLAYPQSGEGIRPAVESALLAAETILAAGGDYRRARLEAYPQKLVDRLGPPRSAGLSGWLPASWLQSLASKLMESRRFARRVVIENWFLHMHQPALTGATVSGAKVPAGV